MCPENERGLISGSRRRFEHRDETFRFSAGYIPSRTMVQYLVQRSRPTERRLEIGEPSDDGLTVSNELRETIRYLLVVAPDGRYFTRDDRYEDADGNWSAWETGTDQRLVATDRDTEIRRYSKLLKNFELAFPPGFDPSLLRDQLFGAGLMRGRGGLSNEGGILELRLKAMKKLEEDPAQPRQLLRDC